jgi:pyruvate/2-oxoglutarate dehydrogenase complex dihydrolipoamide acyltransferase (E2) component
MSGSAPSFSERPLRGQEAFVYGFKQRAKQHHCLGYATFTVDVAALGELRKAYSRTIAPITYLPLYVKAVALTLARHPEANAILFKRWYGRRIARFDQVDVNLPITRRRSGSVVTFIGTVRDAPSKSLAEIQAELEHLLRDPVESLFAVRRILWFENRPLWLARLIHSWMARSPSFYLRNVGTCGLTLAENTCEDHFFPIAPTSVVFGLGNIHAAPVVRHDQVAVGRVLKCSLMVDNYVVSGLLAAKLLREFKVMLESGEFIRSELAAAGTVA